MVSAASVRKILFLAANPQGTGRLRLDQEVRDIEEGLRRSQKREQFVLTSQWAVRPRDVQRAMLDLNPQIVHFSGHGEGSKFVGEAARSEPTRKAELIDNSGAASHSPFCKNGLVFEDEMGNPKLVSGEALAGLFGLFIEHVECCGAEWLLLGNASRGDRSAYPLCDWDDAGDRRSGSDRVCGGVL